MWLESKLAPTTPVGKKKITFKVHNDRYAFVVVENCLGFYFEKVFLDVFAVCILAFIPGIYARRQISFLGSRRYYWSQVIVFTQLHQVLALHFKLLRCIYAACVGITTVCLLSRRVSSLLCQRFLFVSTLWHLTKVCVLKIIMLQKAKLSPCNLN